MSPTLRTGDVVDVRDVAQSPLNSGDIVLALVDNQWICHRFIREDNGRILLKGDATTSEDTAISRASVIGVVTRIHQRPRLAVSPRRLRERLLEGMRRICIGLEWLRPAIASPEDLLGHNRRFYAKPALRQHMQQPISQLTAQETQSLAASHIASGPVLVLGAGAGREAQALWVSGFHVTALEQDFGLYQSGKKRFPELRWVRSSILESLPPGPFDLVTLWGQLYNLIPGRDRRIQCLRRCRSIISPKGAVLLGVAKRSAPSTRELVWHPWRLRVARWIGGNTDVQIGDRWPADGVFQHEFLSADEVIEECSAAGWKADVVSDDEDTYLVLRPVP